MSTDILSTLTESDIGRVSDKIAKDLDFGSGRNLDKAQYIYNNAPEEVIKQLDEGQLSINKAYNTLKQNLSLKDEENRKLKNAVRK